MELDGGDEYIYLIAVNVHLNVVKRVNFILCVFYPNAKKFLRKKQQQKKRSCEQIQEKALDKIQYDRTLSNNNRSKLL